VSWYQKGKTNLDFTEARDSELLNIIIIMQCLTRHVSVIRMTNRRRKSHGGAISWAICKSAPCSRQITMPAPHYSVFTGQMSFLPPNQQRQSTEGTSTEDYQNTENAERTICSSRLA